MAEAIISPGVFQIESDQSLYTQAPPALGAAIVGPTIASAYRDWETDRKSTRLNSSHEIPSRMPSSA